MAVEWWLGQLFTVAHGNFSIFNYTLSVRTRKLSFNVKPTEVHSNRLLKEMLMIVLCCVVLCCVVPFDSFLYPKH